MSPRHRWNMQEDKLVSLLALCLLDFARLLNYLHFLPFRSQYIYSASMVNTRNTEDYKYCYKSVPGLGQHNMLFWVKRNALPAASFFSLWKRVLPPVQYPSRILTVFNSLTNNNSIDISELRKRGEREWTQSYSAADGTEQKRLL